MLSKGETLSLTWPGNNAIKELEYKCVEVDKYQVSPVKYLQNIKPGSAFQHSLFEGLSLSLCYSAQSQLESKH